VSGSVVPVGDLPDRGPVTLDIAVPASALAVAAHPDDVEFGCGATLAKWAAQGCRIHHLVLTDGSRGTWEDDGDIAELVRTRHTEQVEAARRLGGGGVDFLDLADGELESGLAQRRAVCEVIRRLRPAVLLGHDPWRRYRLHPDHRHAGWLVVDSLVAAREPAFAPELGAPHRPTGLLLWEADEPNHVEDATATREAKVAALLAHRSQYRSTFGIAPDDPEAEAAVRRQVDRQLADHGRLAGITFGEAFRLISQL
jgi:LmbE family N-acetylglucosaminyl deacetylase